MKVACVNIHETLEICHNNPKKGEMGIRTLQLFCYLARLFNAVIFNLCATRIFKTCNARLLGALTSHALDCQKMTIANMEIGIWCEYHFESQVHRSCNRVASYWSCCIIRLHMIG